MSITGDIQVRKWMYVDILSLSTVADITGYSYSEINCS
jgi:hypothetical protein